VKRPQTKFHADTVSVGRLQSY